MHIYSMRNRSYLYTSVLLWRETIKLQFNYVFRPFKIQIQNFSNSNFSLLTQLNLDYII